MSRGLPSSPHRRRLVATVTLLVAFFSAGCVSAIDGATDRYRADDDWRPPRPEQEDYLIHSDSGFRAPHPFRYDGPVETVLLQGMRIETETGGLSATHIIERAAAPFDDAPPRPETMTDDATLRGDLESGRDVLHVRGAEGHIVHDGGTIPLADVALYITAPEGGITIAGDVALDIHHPLTLDSGTARLHFAGWPFPLDEEEAEERPALAATPREEVQIDDVRVRWGPLDEDGRHANDVNGTVVLDAGKRIVLGAPAFHFVPQTLAVRSPDAVGSALGGYRTVDPLGTLRLHQAQGTLHLRDETLAFEQVAVHVADLDRLVYNATLSTLDVRGNTYQVLEGTRAWIESEIDIDHPSRDGTTLTVTLRVPPGKTFRTMLGVHEVSGVGSAIDIQPSVGRNDGHIETRLGEHWEDERVLDDRLSRAFVDAFGAMFWIPDGQVRLGPQATAWLPVSFDVPENLEQETEVELVLHPRNAEVLHVTFVLVPDAAAATSDVSSKTPVPLWVPLVAVTLVGLALRRRR